MKTIMQYLITGLLMLLSIEVSAVVINYTYDDLNRLTSIVRDDQTARQWRYDEVSNITIRNQDNDGDGLPNIHENRLYGTNANNPDHDGDGLIDGQEVFAYNTQPNVKDTDGDGFDDGVEVTAGSNPLNPSSTPTGNAADEDIPTLPQWGMILFAMLLMLSAMKARGRRPL